MRKTMRKTKWSLYATILAAAFLAASLVLPVLRGESPIDLGLDLSGGVVVTYRPDFSSRPESAGEPQETRQTEAELLALAKETLTSRLYRTLDTVPDVVVRGDQRIVVSLPSTDGQDHRILDLVGKTYHLTMRLVQNGRPAPGEQRPGQTAGGGQTERLYEYQGRRLRLAEAEFSGDMLDPRRIRVETGASGDPYELPQATVTFRFQPPYDEAFAELTGANVGRELAILLDDEIEWAGRIDSEIDGEGLLRGGYRLEEAREVAGMLRSGTMPVSLEVESLSAVGPPLGQEIQDLGLDALMLSLVLLVAVLAIAYLHRGSLLIAGVASLFCLLLLIAGIVAAFSLTLDLVGIAGLVLSLGMGMDAFILVFESLEGKPGRAADRAASRRGWTIRKMYSFAGQGGTLFHANATTLIVIALLLATERLKSFAVFIFVGILASVLTILFTRWLLRRAHGRLGALGPDLLCWLRRRRPGLLRWRKAYLVLSGVPVAGLLFAALAGTPGLPELGADFTAGTQVVVSAPRQEQVASALDDLRRQLPGIDARRQALGAPGDDRYLVTIGRALELEGDDESRLRAERLLAVFAAQSVEVESVSSIDAKLSSRRLGGSLGILVLSFFFLAVYFVVCQGPIDRALGARRFPRKGAAGGLGGALPASAQLTVWSGVLLAVLLDVAVVLAVTAVLGIPINLPVVAGLLTILGYSVNDSVVLWSHIRRRWAESRGERSATRVVTAAVDAMLSRALLTSLSTLVPALVILAVGLTPLVDFAWVIIAGVISGTLSSIFVVGWFAVRALERQAVRRHAPSPGLAQSRAIS